MKVASRSRSPSHPLPGLLRQLTEQASTIVLHHDRHQFTLSATLPAGRVHVSADSLLLVVQMALGVAPTIRCQQCGTRKHAGCFPPNEDFRHGREPICYICKPPPEPSRKGVFYPEHFEECAD